MISQPCLKKNGLDIIIVDDTPQPYTPDSIFPNNWVSFHENGTVVLYPMFAANRRAERKEHVLSAIAQGFLVKKTIDFSEYENQNRFLEGTGSMVLYRDKYMAYACLSPRTDRKVLDDFCQQMNFTAVAFDAVDAEGKPFYHTNVMMSVADRFVVICLDSIKDAAQRREVETAIKNSGKQIIPITLEQVKHFAGNMLQVENNKWEKLLIMSTQAYQSLTEEQIKLLTGFNAILHAPLTTIETNGGGSARCMMAEVHLKVKR